LEEFIKRFFCGYTNEYIDIFIFYIFNKHNNRFTIILLSLGAGISYLIKNLFTNSNQELFKNEKTDENM
jgi:hypothetical protein